MRWLKVWAAASALACAAGPSALAAGAAATPETLAQVVAAARPGDTITLQPGEYRGIRIAKRHFDPHITLDAQKATIYNLIINASDGIDIRGGEFRLLPPTPHPMTGAPVYGSALAFVLSNHVSVGGAHFVGPGHPDSGDGFAYGEGKGVLVNVGDGVVIEDSTFTGFVAAVTFNRVENFRVSRITSVGMRSDTVDMAASHHGVIEYVRCSDTLTRGAEHPDCIQGWSVKGLLPTSDIVVRHNSVVGNTQGISFFNRDGGGFDRITIEDNDVEIGHPNGVSLFDARDSVVRRNHVRTLKGSRYRAGLKTSGAKACDNVVESGAGKAGFSDDKC
jgi:hypothetical protein